MDWILPANSKMYDHKKAFEDFGFIDWRQNYNFEIGDIVYIYATRPESRLMFRTQVLKTNMPFNQIRDDKDYWHDLEEYNKSISKNYARLVLLETLNDSRLTLDKLLKNGLNSAPQSSVKIKGMLKQYLDDIFQEQGIEEEYVEGHVKKTYVNKYERNNEARLACIKHFGYDCQVCGFNFKKIYGNLGDNFIEVHHLLPLSQIKKNYRVDPISDLIPVCSNCHSMLHRKGSKEGLQGVDDLRIIIKLNYSV